MDENRVKHSLEVAKKMIKIGKINGLGDNDIKNLFMLGYLHDIGYMFGVV